MKKLLNIILFLAFMPLLNAQIDISKVIFGSKIVSFQGGVVSYDDSWETLIINSYLDINSHYSTLYANEISDYLYTIFNSNYIMSDGSDNYYTRFSDSTEANWFYVYRFMDNTTQAALSITKTGDVMKWQLDDSVYTQNNIPEHPINQGAGFGILTSTDQFDGITYYYSGGSSWTGELPKFNISAERMYINTNNYFGTLPNIINPVCKKFIATSNFFTEVEGLSGILNGLLDTYSLNICMLSQTAVDLIISEFLDYYTINTPTRNVALTINGDGNAALSTTGLANKSLLETVFTNAGRTITILNN